MQADSYGLGTYQLKLLHLTKNATTGKMENVSIVTTAQWQMELPCLICIEISIELNGKFPEVSLLDYCRSQC